MCASPSISPAPPDDQDVYLVLDDFGGRLGRTWRESPEERTGRDQVLTDLLDGQFSDPVRVVAFNTVTRCARDVSREIADEILSDHNRKGLDIPAFLQNFIERRSSGRLQLGLPLG
jgi:hypothetical protein